MKQEEREKVYDFLSVKKEDCIGINESISDLEKGMTFYVTPMFMFPAAKDSFTFEEAVRVSRIHSENKSYDYELRSALGCFHHLHKIVKVQKKIKKGESFAYLRVINTVTMVEFNIIKDDFELDDFSSFDLLFINY